jgi:hypothetical protein
LEGTKRIGLPIGLHFSLTLGRAFQARQATPRPFYRQIDLGGASFFLQQMTNTYSAVDNDPGWSTLSAIENNKTLSKKRSARAFNCRPVRE